MENVRILDLKKALFYYFFSWRMVLLCVALCVALAVGLTYLRPASMQSDAMSSADANVLAEQRTKFMSENAEAKMLAAEISKLKESLYCWKTNSRKASSSRLTQNVGSTSVLIFVSHLFWLIF